MTSSLVSDGSDGACRLYLWAERPRQGNKTGQEVAQKVKPVLANN